MLRREVEMRKREDGERWYLQGLNASLMYVRTPEKRAEIIREIQEIKGIIPHPDQA